MRRAPAGLWALPFLVCAIALSWLAATFAKQTTEDSLARLYKTRQWFELRSAMSDRSPVLIRGAVAAAFNDAETAERLLQSVIRSQPTSSDADDAYALLTRMYQRSGQYSRFVKLYRQWASALPDSQQMRGEFEAIQKYEGRPDQINGPRRRLNLRHPPGGLSLPVSINGKTDDFLFDTGAWQSAMTEREAEKLGLAVSGETKTLTGSSGLTATFRTVVVKELMLGAMRFRDVSFAVISPGGPFRDAELGIVGLPILLALENIRWSKDGAVEVGGSSAETKPPSPNLVFDRHRLLLRADLLGRQVLTTFDTGANTTDLNANFVKMFKEVVERSGKRGTQDITGVGGTQTFESIELPELAFRIGPTDVTLRPAFITLQTIELTGGECCIGNAGHDLLTQGQGFTIDLSSMTLRLH